MLGTYAALIKLPEGTSIRSHLSFPNWDEMEDECNIVDDIEILGFPVEDDKMYDLFGSRTVNYPSKFKYGGVNFFHFLSLYLSY